MARVIGMSVGILLVCGAALADITTVPLTRGTQAERSGERFNLTTAPEGDGKTRVTLRIRPAAAERFVRAEVELLEGGKVVLSVPARAEIDAAGASVEFVVATGAAGTCRIGVLLDSTDKERPNVGRLYQLDLGSYAKER